MNCFSVLIFEKEENQSTQREIKQSNTGKINRLLLNSHTKSSPELALFSMGETILFGIVTLIQTQQIYFRTILRDIKN